MGYAPRLARWLAGGSLSSTVDNTNFTDLGIGGATLDSTDQNLANQPWGPYTGGVHANLMDNEVAPYAGILSKADLVTVYIGKNDVNTLYEAVRNSYYPDAASAVNAFGARYVSYIHQIRNDMPQGSRLVVLNLMNVGLQPGSVIDRESTYDKQLLQTLSVSITQNYINPLASDPAVFAVVDMLCGVASNYDANYYSSDGVHPNDAGYGNIAQAIYTTITTSPRPPAPAGSCPNTQGAPAGYTSAVRRMTK
jgi:lysophospholipase L1-like esterase